MGRFTVNYMKMIVSFASILYICAPQLANAQTCIAGEIKSVSSAGVVTSYTTLQNAVNAAASGATISVGSVSVTSVISISSKSNLTIKTACDAKVGGIDIIKSQGITIDGFIVDAKSAGSRDGIFVSGKSPASSNIIVKNCEIMNAVQNGFEADSYATGVSLLNCSIHNNSKNGVLLSGSGPYAVKNSSLAKNSLDGLNAPIPTNLTIDSNVIAQNLGYGLNIVGKSATPDNLLLTNNTILNNAGKAKAGTSTADIATYSTNVSGNDTGNSTTTGVEGSGTIAVSDVNPPVITIDAVDGQRAIIQ
jgi:hypothetical protein